MGPEKRRSRKIPLLEHARRTQMCSKEASSRKARARFHPSTGKAGIEPDKTKASVSHSRAMK